MEKKKKKTHVPFRLNALFLSVFVLFSILILRLGVIQIVQGQEYNKTAYLTDNVTTKVSAPRGRMYDRYGRVVVDNTPSFSITYTRSRSTSQDETNQIAEELTHYIVKDTKGVTERDKKDYFLYLHLKDVENRVTKQQKKNLSNTDFYNLLLSKVTSDDLKTLTPHQIEVIAIKRIMDGGYALTPQRIKIGATPEEVAKVSEHLSELKGVDIKPDAERTYPYGNSFKEMFGQVSEIPQSMMDYYLSMGNDRNDLVGTSFLEQEYENYLRGVKSQVSIVTDKQGNPLGDSSEQVGSRGDDLVLTLDMQLQQQVEKVVEQNLAKAIKGNPYQNRNLNKAYIVMMDPNTGEILAMAAKEYDRKTGKFNNIPYGNIYDSYAMGSAVKGATVLTGLQQGVITKNTMIYDAPITFGDGRIMKSLENMGNISVYTALKRSSNVYMWNIAMRMSGYDYSHKRFIENKVPEAFQTFRNSFSEFGLGVPTGIDLPGEATGYHTAMTSDLAQAMFYAIGQYDTYTPMQMAQYISTIANGGYRMAPHLLKEVREPSPKPDELGKLLYQYEPKVLNKIDMSQDYLDVVHEGFREVMSAPQGTAAWMFKNKDYQPAGKSGTAEVDKATGMDNKTLVAYAPYNHPEVAISVVVPNIRQGFTNYEIGEGAFDAYFKLKKEGRLKSQNP